MSHWILFDPPFETSNQEKFKKFAGSYEILKKGDKPRYFHNTHTSKGILWSSLDNKPPGCNVYGKTTDFKCSDYYPKYSDCLLNDQYIIVDLHTFLNNKDFYFNALGDTCFVRPDHGDKSFTGSVISSKTSKHDLKRYIFERPLQEMILLAPTRDIEQEYRFVVVRENIVAGSIYKTKKRGHLEFYEKELKKGNAAWTYAQDIINNHYSPCTAFTIDICLTGGDFKVVELNSFSHAGLYKCNIKKIVEAFE